MGQVPTYLIIGDGRVARHFSHYLSLLRIPCRQWSRSQDISLSEIIKDSSQLLLLISDSAIESFIKEHACLSGMRLIHFSGQLVTEAAYGAHPLMTFGPELYTLQDYREIPWILERGAPAFSELLPGLPNPHFVISKQEKNYYHALCVMSNNFTTILWSKFFNEMNDRFQIPKEHLLPILRRTMTNMCGDHEAALTGPLVRGDTSTIEANIASLEGDVYAEVYRAFVAAYLKEES